MDSWNKLSNTLLEKNHIKIPIEKRFFLFAVIVYRSHLVNIGIKTWPVNI